MDPIPSLDDLLKYEEYQCPDLIPSDYFIVDRDKETNPQQQNLQQEPDGNTQEKDLEQELEKEVQQQCSEQQTNGKEQEVKQQTEDENDFDQLMDYYDENNDMNHEIDKNQTANRPSDKLNDIQSVKIYKVLKKLVSFSYERYQKGTHKYDKKEIIKHYLTNQKFKIINDLNSPTFKPDVYVFDLSPSNNESLEMYVNAISSLAIKNSVIYLTYNDCILRKLVIKKTNSQGIDVNRVVNSKTQNNDNFECTIFNEYRSLYEELKSIKDRKIYIFSDFDISYDISRLSQNNQNIVWFSTEKNHEGISYSREFPSAYIGYYVETSGIDDIEKFVLEKNKSKYRKRAIR